MKNTKKLCISTLSIFATACLSLGFVLTNDANASAETPQLASSLSMKYGASVRINSTESYEDNGIRFSATISEAEYEAVRLMDNAVFGMFIMPESYTTRFGELTAENVNVGGVYDWKENKADEYFYGGSEIQAESHRILSMTYTELPDDINNDGYKVINGSVVAIKDENLDMNYVGRAFIRYEVDGAYFYEMADWSEGYAGNNVRSVTGVAQKAIEDKNSDLTDEQRKALSDAYTTKSLTVQGYTAITSAEDFAAMNADGKYYLANDITISAAYANEFTGVFNGNGKAITLNGTSMFSAFAGTFTNADLTASTSIISSMNGGLVDGLTVYYTYSEAAANAIAASSKRISRVENCIMYTSDSKAAFVGEVGAFVSNCVKTTDTSATYSEITFATENGQLTKFVKNGADVSNKFVYGAVSTLAGTINAWNKDFATVTGNATYFATDYETVYDSTKEWTKMADSAITDAKTGSTPAPYGYEKVNVGAMTWVSTSIEKYTSVRFAAKMSGYFLLSGWDIYSDANDWMQIVMDQQENGKWTVTVYGPVFDGSAWVDSYQKTDVEATTVAEAMSFLTFASYTTYATEVYGVEKEVEKYGTVVVQEAIAGSTATTAVKAPDGFGSAYEYAKIPANTSFANVDISGYSEVKFNMWLDKGYICIKSWGAYAENAGWGKQWVPITLTNNNDGTWTILIEALIAGVNQNPYSYSVSGTTLDAVLATWFDFTSESATIYITEIRGVEIQGSDEPEEFVVVEQALVGSTASQEAAPAGFETVYAKTSFAKGDFADVKLTEYVSIRFMVKANGWILFDGWASYVDKRNTWLTVDATCNEGQWTVTVDGTERPCVASGRTLKGIFANWCTDFGNFEIYVTEVLGVKGEAQPVGPWGSVVDTGVVLGATLDTTVEAPNGFENVYAVGTISTTNKSTVDISGYSEVRFAVKSTKYFLINGWAVYFKESYTDWAPVVMKNNGDGTWRVTIYGDVFTGSTSTVENPYVVTYTGNTLNEILATWETSGATTYVTELRGVKNGAAEVPEATQQPVLAEMQANTVLWGEQITDNGAVGFLETSAVVVPNSYENVVAGIPATTASIDGNCLGEFFKAVDVSAYAEVRFAFKSSSWMLFGGWGSYVHVPNEWVSVKMVQTSTNAWAVTVYAKNAVTGADPFTVNYTGSTLQEILISWYNAAGETFYMTDVRGIKGKVDKTVVIDSCVLNSDVTLDTAAVAPDGFTSVYKVGGTFDTNKKSTTDLSGYAEVRFAIKSEKYFLINGWNVYFRESYTDWATVVMKNNGDNSWTVSVYGDVFTGTAYANPYVVTYTGNSVATILKAWYNGSNVYVTELRGVRSGVYCDVKISNLACTTVYDTTDVTAPDGYENAYRKDGLAKGDFAALDISSYAEVNFQIQSKSWILYGGWAGSIHTPNKWIAVRLVNQGGNAWKVFVNGVEETTLAYSGKTLSAVLANWYNDQDATFYVTELRGVHGTYTVDQIKAIAMLQSDKTTQTKKAAMELSKLLKELTGVELLVEYYDNVGELDANKRYLLLGRIAAGEVDASLLTTDTGYVMQKVGNHVALYATTGDGMYNAVYGFLNTYFGVEFYTDSVMTYTDDNAVIGGAEKVVFNPDIEYTWAVDGLLTDGANGDYNWDYVVRIGYSNFYSQIGGGVWHNFLSIISEEKYGANGTVAQRSEWFVTKTDTNGQSFKTLNIATYGDEIAVAVANEFAAMINANPSVDVWQFSAPDYKDSAFTSNEYVAFMNKVAVSLDGQIYRKVNLMLLAYNSMYEAPTTDFVRQTNVGFTVMVAPIGMNYYYGFDNTTFTDSNGHTNAWYLEQITAWSAKADELYVWNYSEYFDNYFVPLDTITNMQAKYQAYVNAGATGIYDQGCGEANATDWAELKVYLKSALAQDVNADVNALISGFMRAYYGEQAAPYMLQLLQAQQAHYATIANKMHGGHITRDSLFNKSYWGTDGSNAMLTEWYGYIQSALNATTDVMLKARIQKESLTVRYLHQVLFNSGYVNKKTLTVTTVAGSTVTDSLSHIITDAKALGITRFAEGQGWVCNDGTIIGTNNIKDGVIDNLA